MAKYEKQRVDIILDAIGRGLSQKDAGILAGVNEDTISRWKKDKADFAEKVLQKEVEFKQIHIVNIQNEALAGTWQASAWFLERKFPKEFGQKAELSDDAKKQVEELQAGLKGFFNDNVGTAKKTKNKNTRKAQGNVSKTA